MKQVMNEVAYQNDSRTKSNFSLSHDVNTSLELGYTDPLTCISVPNGGSHFKLSPVSNSVVRFDPLVKPTFGRCNLHTFTAFCPNSDLHPFYDAFLSGEKVATPSGIMQLNSLPQVSAPIFMAMILRGSYYCYYERSGADVVSNKYISPRSSGVVSLIPLDTTHLSNMFTDSSADWIDAYCSLFGDDATGEHKAHQVTKVGSLWSPNAGDIVCAYHDSTNNKDVIFSFRICAKARRLLKVFNAIGYKLYFTKQKVYNVLPLIGYAKTYFDYFRLPTYAVGELSNHVCTQLYQFFHLHPNIEIDTYDPVTDAEIATFYNAIGLLCDYIANEMWFIEDKNYLSVHRPTTATTSVNNKYATAQVGVNASTTDFLPERQVQTVMDSIAELGYSVDDAQRNGSLMKLDYELINQPNLELLKKLYYTCNRQAAIGNDVAKILKALGYNEEVENMKSTYIGSTSKLLNVTEVTNSTEQLGDMPLGDVAGKSVTYSSDEQVFDFDAWTSGYIYTFVCVMPQSGSVNQVPNWLDATDRYSVYNPEFDGFGYEVSDKSIIGTIPRQNSRSTLNGDHNWFGVCPRYLSYKQHTNILNGVFQLPSLAEGMSPYHFDKLIFKNPFKTEGDETNGWVSDWKNTQSGSDILPSAGSIWRHPQSSDFLTNYYRVFVDSSAYGGVQHDESLGFFDKIYLQTPYFCVMNAPLVPIENGFETLEDKQRISKSYTKTKN